MSEQNAVLKKGDCKEDRETGKEKLEKREVESDGKENLNERMGEMFEQMLKEEKEPQINKTFPSFHCIVKSVKKNWPTLVDEYKAWFHCQLDDIKRRGSNVLEIFDQNLTK